jgi:hypothetical protein
MIKEASASSRFAMHVVYEYPIYPFFLIPTFIIKLGFTGGITQRKKILS